MGRLMVDGLFNTWMGIVLLALWLCSLGLYGIEGRGIELFFSSSCLRKIDGNR